MPTPPLHLGHPGTDRRLEFLARSFGALAIVVFGAMLAFSCNRNTGPSCSSDEICSCSGEQECVLGCYADNCRLECSNTANTCGTVCMNGCEADCHDTKVCSHSCGEHCRLTCGNTEQCGGFCGADCQYECHDMTLCGVHVGADSAVTCRSVDTCEVECEGACNVVCDQVQSCRINCLASGIVKDYPNGSYSCPSPP